MDPDRLYAEMYDCIVHDWPGEIEFYHAAASDAKSILEVACGTGRIGLRLAREQADVFGFDLSPHMIAIARSKSTDIPNAHWEVADMTSFELGRQFDLVIVPGHSFQAMLTIEDQLSCLKAIRMHLKPGRTAIFHIDHQDVHWLGGLPHEEDGSMGASSEAKLTDGRCVRISKRWSYQRATQTAALISKYEVVDDKGGLIETAMRGPIQMHCFFRNEMEHLLRRAGYAGVRVFGGFDGQALGEDSSEMVWIASRD